MTTSQQQQRLTTQTSNIKIPTTSFNILPHLQIRNLPIQLHETPTQTHNSASQTPSKWCDFQVVLFQFKEKTVHILEMIQAQNKSFQITTKHANVNEPHQHQQNSSQNASLTHNQN